MNSLLILAICFAFCKDYVVADTPGNCTYNDVIGSWVFSVGDRMADKSIDCTQFAPESNHNIVKLRLEFPDVAVDQFGNRGFWTMVYNQGFEVVIHGRKYFAYSKYKGSGQGAVSLCHETLPGWSHDLLSRDWRCYVGKKAGAVDYSLVFQPSVKPLSTELFKHDDKMVEEINWQQSLWKAHKYKEYEAMTVAELSRRGGMRNRLPRMPKKMLKKPNTGASPLPESFDWRNVNGENFVSPVRNQGGCGSCYAFSSMGMLEARWRIATNNTVTPVFSPQDVVDCSKYSQGCEGGFPYLIAGKYAEDYGVVAEDCDKYRGSDGKCGTPPSCRRYFATNYRYVGGYYGGCSEEAMKRSLVYDGPMSVSFEVYPDFQLYKGGIYKHTFAQNRFNPFEITNHAVLLVGYGEEKGTPFWIVKNSWGESWGENGYFRIIRGQDECSIESIAVEVDPILGV